MSERGLLKGYEKVGRLVEKKFEILTHLNFELNSRKEQREKGISDVENPDKLSDEVILERIKVFVENQGLEKLIETGVVNESDILQESPEDIVAFIAMQDLLQKDQQTEAA